MLVTGLDRILKNAGVPYEGTSGWRTRSLNRAGLSSTIKNVMWHTTETADSAFAGGANFPTLNYVINGLGYPLYNILIGRNGHARIIAAGSAAHAGNGTGGGMTRNNGNREAIAVSFDSNSSKYPVNAAQLEAGARIGKALNDDWKGNIGQIMHGEWSTMRSDPTKVPGGWSALREAIKKGSWDGSAPAPAASSGSNSKKTATGSASSSKSVATLAREVIDGKHGSGDARKRALGNRYSAVQAEVNKILGGGSSPSSRPAQKSVATLAKEVIDGKHGSGDARKRALGSRYNAVQAEVNRILGGGKSSSSSSSRKSAQAVAQDIANGRGGWGNDPGRSRKLNAAGYNAADIQRRVNALLSGRSSSSSSRKSVGTIAKEVIDGKWGNEPTRSQRLRKAGYNAAAVQAEVNRRLR